MPSKSWDFFDPATNIHWHLLWDKVIWMVPPQHVHPQHTNLGAPEGLSRLKMFVPEVLTANQPWWQLEMLWERDAFVYWKWLFLQNCCSMSCIWLPLTIFVCVCVCSLGNFDSSEAFGILPRAVHSSNREVPWLTKLKTGHTEKMCNPELRTPKKEPLVIICWDITLCSIRKILVSLAPNVSAKATFTPEGLVDKANTTRNLQSRGHLRIRRQKGCVGL